MVWNDEIYSPKYPIVCGNSSVYTADGLFARSLITDTKVPITISGTRADTIFQDCTELKRIPSLTFENVVRFTTSSFRQCRELVEMNVYGEINVGGMDVSASTKLNHDSLMSIINALKDFSGTGGTYTVTFGKTNLEKLTDAEKAQATQKGWTLL